MALNWMKIKNIIVHNALKKDQHGIYQRYLREQEAWTSHLEKCHQTIEQQIGSGKKIAILGSGWLLDVPLNYLLDHFAEVHCYDINHPKPLKHRLRNHNRIKFISFDITNGLYDLLSKNLPSSDILKLIINGQWSLNWDEYDTIVSLNLLNQLDILFIGRLKKRYTFDQSMEDALRTKIQYDHLSSMPEGKALLISDIIETSEHLKTKKVSQKDLIYTSLPSDKLINEWDWFFDSVGNYSQNHKTTFRVHAYRF